MLAVEADYAAREAQLQEAIDNIESSHPGYDEYRYDLCIFYSENTCVIINLIFCHLLVGFKSITGNDFVDVYKRQVLMFLRLPSRECINILLLSGLLRM